MLQGGGREGGGGGKQGRTRRRFFFSLFLKSALLRRNGVNWFSLPNLHLYLFLKGDGEKVCERVFLVV